MLTMNRLMTNLSRRARTDHWLAKEKGISLIDLYDVTTKLAFIHKCIFQWEIMPYIGSEYFPTYLGRGLHSLLRHNKNFLAIPAGTDRHWTYILVDLKSRTIEHWDGMGNNKSFEHPLTQFRLKQVYSYLGKYVGPDFRIINCVPHTHQNKHGYCGFHAVRFLEERMKGFSSGYIANNLNYDIEFTKFRYYRIRSTPIEKIRFLYNKKS